MPGGGCRSTGGRSCALTSARTTICCITTPTACWPSRRRFSAWALIIQAHPYRRKCTPAIACYLDGVEVMNRNPRHENHNDRAEEYAAQFGLLRLGGSDCHRPEDIGLGGILTRELPEDGGALARLIREGRYTVIGAE